MNFIEELEKIGIHLNDRQLKQFECYYERLVSVNEVMNLTAITNKNEVYRKHFLDSLELHRVLKNQKVFHLCDVGSGAGFPAIPLAIIYPQSQFTIIDALNKRIHFLNELIEELKLTNVVALHERAEDYCKKYHKQFDFVAARAVARLNILVELCLPLVSVGGQMIAMKGNSAVQEVLEAHHAVEVLGGKIEDEIHFCLPEELEERVIVLIRKIKSTPKGYPRPFAKIKDKPL